MTDQTLHCRELKAIAERVGAVLTALDIATGDTDPNIDPDMTDDEVRDEYPEVWACQQLTEIHTQLQAMLNTRAQEATCKDHLQVAGATDGGEAVANTQRGSSMDAQLCDFGSRWKMDGDYLRCRKCSRPHLASYADVPFRHASDCTWSDGMETHPWRTLVKILSPLYTRSNAKAGEANVPAIPDGWVFFFADDAGTPYATYCASRDDIYKEVAIWMTGDIDGEAESDFGDDMIGGVTDTLIEAGLFSPEGDPPCFLRKANALSAQRVEVQS